MKASFFHPPERIPEAYWLAAQSEVACRTDADRFGEAQLLRHRIENLLQIQRVSPLGEAPGHVDLDGFGLYLRCAGKGSPTVIFENGLGAGLIDSWHAIQPAISTVTQTCVYDRRNIGLSQQSAPLGEDAVRTTQDMVDDLVWLLDSAGIDPPYVLVGHSFGGLINLLFIDQHPAMVQGLVLVDAGHPDQTARFSAVWDDFEVPAANDPMNREHVDILASESQLTGIADLGDMPLAILTAGLSSQPETARQVWLELQADHAGRSTTSLHISADNSGHFIMRDEPELVIDAIIWVLNAVHAVND